MTSNVTSDSRDKERTSNAASLAPEPTQPADSSTSKDEVNKETATPETTQSPDSQTATGSPRNLPQQDGETQQYQLPEAGLEHEVEDGFAVVDKTDAPPLDPKTLRAPQQIRTQPSEPLQTWQDVNTDVEAACGLDERGQKTSGHVRPKRSSLSVKTSSMNLSRISSRSPENFLRGSSPIAGRAQTPLTPDNSKPSLFSIAGISQSVSKFVGGLSPASADSSAVGTPTEEVDLEKGMGDDASMAGMSKEEKERERKKQKKRRQKAKTKG